MENYSLRDELDGTSIITEKNIETQQEMEFSTPISDVIDVPAMSQSVLAEVPSSKPAQAAPSSSKYPLNLKKEQVEALIAGIAGVIGFSDFVQNKLIDNIPQAIKENGKLSVTGMVITLLVIAVAFYFIRKFTLNR